jgi:hypothetical protein
VCRNKNKPGNARVNNVNVDGATGGQDEPHTSVASDTENPQYAFHVPVVCSSSSLERVDITLGGIVSNFIIDTGSDCNVISQETYEHLKANKFKILDSSKGGPSILPYTATTAIQPLGHFWCDITLTNRPVTLNNVKFTVIPQRVDSLLGIDTAKKLGVVQIVANVSTMSDYETRYPRLFSDRLGKSNVEIKLTIREDIEPVAQPLRRVPVLLREKFEEHLNELVEQDIIERVDDHIGSKWVSPAVIVPKKDGRIRLCIDMRRANQAIVRHHHPVPTVEEMLHDMNGARYFSKLDLKMGFHQFRLHPESRDITTFSTHVGLFRYKRLMFGINAAPEIYQKEVSKIIQGLPGVANLADDIIIHATTREEHDRRLNEVFSRLELANMTVNKNKCAVGVQQVEFLGHTLSHRGIDPDKEKVAAVKGATTPKTVGEVRSFLGLTSYLSKFVPHYSHTTDVLRRLIAGRNSREGVEFSAAELSAFNQLKADLSSTSTLAHFDAKCDTLLYTDASPVGLGAILVQLHKGEPKVISYGSRALSEVEQRYMQIEKEALAVVWACERFHHYLFGCRFKIISDCEPLESILGKKDKRSSLRIERWQLRLQSYDFQIAHVKSADNIADSLSRLLISKRAEKDLVETEDVELYVRNVVQESAPVAITPRMVEEAAFSDPELSKVRQAIRTDSLEQADISPVYKAIRSELCAIGELILRGSRIIIPKSLRHQVLEVAHEGHTGIVGTKRYLRTRVWWPGLDGDVERYIRQCHECQLTGKTIDRPPVRVTELPNGPWEDLAIDLLGPLSDGSMVGVLVDYYSRWVEVKFMTTTTTAKIVDWLGDVFQVHGLPMSIRSDSGSQFTANEFADFCDRLGIHHLQGTPKWPESNGEVERQNRSLMKRIQIAHSNHADYKTAVQQWMFIHRNTPHSITGKTPSEMLFGRPVRTKIPGIQAVFNDIEARDRDTELKNRMIHDRNARLGRGSGTGTIEVGSSVLVRRDDPSKCQTPFHPTPFEVVEAKGSQITVRSRAGKLYKRNISHLRPYHWAENSVVGDASDSRQEEADPGTNGRLMGTPGAEGCARPVETAVAIPPCPTPPAIESEPRRSTRQRRRPAHLDAYVTD